MTDTEDVRGNPGEETAEAETPERSAAPAEPDAGPREILIGIVVIAVMIVGLVYAYNQGLETGTVNGRQEVLADTPAWVESVRGARMAGGIRLAEGQQVHVRVTGPGEEEQETLLAEAPGTRVAILVETPEEDQAEAGTER
jgi:hypothetical protein